MSQRICKITLPDNVNALISGVDNTTAKKLHDALRYFKKGAQFSPKYELGIWDGYINLYKKGWTYINIINEDILDIITTANYQIQIVDNRVQHDIELETITSDYFKDYLDKEGNPTEIRYYQVDTINIAIENRRGLFEISTGAGKTILTAGLASRFVNKGKVLMIVPRTDLLIQTAKVFNYYGMSTGEFWGQEKIVKDVTIATWQSATKYPEILEGVSCVICDEAHEYTAKEVFEFLTVAARNVPHVYGFTATLPEETLGRNQLKAVFGDVLYSKPAHELQDEGFLSTIEITILQTQESKHIVHEHYAKERKYLLENDARNKAIANFISEVSQTGNTLVLYRNIETGERLKKLLPDAVMIAGSGKHKSKNKEREIAYKDLDMGDNAILGATFGIASTGIDITRVFNLVAIDMGTDYKQVIQIVGRGLRKGQDKDHLQFYDIYSSLKYAKSQKTKRKRHYKTAKYPHKERKLSYNEIPN